MTGLRLPPFTKGQADDGAVFTSIGAGLMWLAGGPASVALGLLTYSGLTIALNHSNIGDDTPKLNYNPDLPPEKPTVPFDQILPQFHAEREIKEEFGQNALNCYRTMVSEGQDPWDAKNRLQLLLTELKRRGLWKDGKLVGDPNETPEQRLTRDIEQKRQNSLKTAKTSLDVLRTNIDAYIDGIGLLPRPERPNENFEDEYKDDVEDDGGNIEEDEFDPTEFLLPPSGQPVDMANEMKLMQLQSSEHRDFVCYLYRKLRSEGESPQDAFTLAQRGMEQNKHIYQKGSHNPQPRQRQQINCIDNKLHYNSEGFWCASPDLMGYLNPKRVVEYAAENMTPKERAETHPDKGINAAIKTAACVAYIIGAPPVTDPVVRRMVYWPECEPYDKHSQPDPIYFVLNNDWYIAGCKADFEYRFDCVCRALIPEDRSDLFQEAQQLLGYRLEVYHHHNEPPGYSGMTWLSVFTGGTHRIGPASPEDMKGRP